MMTFRIQTMDWTSLLEKGIAAAELIRGEAQSEAQGPSSE
jgi:hypothetical protein